MKGSSESTEDSSPPPSGTGDTVKEFSTGKSMRGKKDRQEDFSFAGKEVLAGERRVVLHAVFDGHSGLMAAELCFNHVGQVLERVLTRNPLCSLMEAAETTVQRLEKKVNRALCWHQDRSGTTAVLALEEGSRLVVASLGDSLAVLGSAGPVGSPPLFCSVVDQLRTPDEERRLVELAKLSTGATVRAVVKQGMVNHAVQVDGFTWEHKGQGSAFWTTPTRNIGSYLWKSYPRRPGENVVKELQHPLLYPGLSDDDCRIIEESLGRILLAQPRVEEIDLAAIDEPLLVIGSDGIWDVMQPLEALDLVRGWLQEDDVLVRQLSGRLCEHAIVRGSQDNVSAVVVRMRGRDAPRRDLGFDRDK